MKKHPVFWRHFLGILVVLLITQMGYSQNALTSNTRYHNGFEICVGYLHTNFLNNQYAGFKQAGELTHAGGITGGVRYTLSPVMFDLNLFSSGFDWPDANYGINTEVDEQHRGVEASIAFLIAPRFKWAKPYLGLGYQSSSLRAKYEDGDETIVVSSVNTSQALWRIGFSAELKQTGYGIIFEYKQSLPNSMQFNEGLLEFGYGPKAMHHIGVLLMLSNPYEN
jgi:hypothetical protein